MKQFILKKICKELLSLSKENPKSFFYKIDGYSDDYDKDGLRFQINEWNKKEEDFFHYLPITWELVQRLIEANDGTEKNISEYEEIISKANEALEEINKALDTK